MTLLRRSRGVVEEMDRPEVDPRHLRSALRQVAAVNRWLGARRSLLRHLPAALGAVSPHRGRPHARPSDRTSDQPAGPPARILDVGTGSGDLPLAIVRWARGRLPIEVTAVDLHEQTLAVARERTAAAPSIRLVRADGLRLPFAAASFDLALLSMTLHHMDGPALVDALRELARVARGGRILVGELERAIPHYLGARLLAATVWRRNPVTRHDGPLSVLRAFTPAELLELAHRAGLRGPQVHRHPFYRLVLTAGAGADAR